MQQEEAKRLQVATTKLRGARGRGGKKEIFYIMLLYLNLNFLLISNFRIYILNKLERYDLLYKIIIDK